MTDFELIMIILSSVSLFLLFVIFCYYLFVIILPSIFIIDDDNKKAKKKDIDRLCSHISILEDRFDYYLRRIEKLLSKDKYNGTSDSKD